ncbi:AAA family ATPase [Desulfoplanes sp. PS50]
MITRLYIHNFRTLLNFEVQLKDFNLLIGRNGSGKTSILEVLGRLRRFIVDGAGVDDLYPEKDISTLASKMSGRFEIDVHTGGMDFRYEIEIAHDLEKKKSRIEKEVLLEDGNIIFENIMGEATLYNDSYGKGPSFPIDWSRSGLNVVMPRDDNTKLIAFKEYMGNVCVSRLNPMVMRAESRGEAQTPAENMEHFSDWYRYLLQAEPGKTALISQKLAPALPGFKYLTRLSGLAISR